HRHRMRVRTAAARDGGGAPGDPRRSRGPDGPRPFPALERRTVKRKTISVETVAEAYLTLLAERGIEYLFVNGGTDFAPIVEAVAALDAKGGRKPNIVSVGHENVAVSMAHGYFLISGRPQAVMFHVNVGTANGINALANAARDNIPLLFTAGRNPITEFGRPGSRDTGIQWGQEMFDQDRKSVVEGQAGRHR